MLINDHLKITEESKIHIKDYDFFSSNQVNSINFFNQLPQDEREFLLKKVNEEEIA